MNAPPDSLHRLLLPGGASQTGFLAPGERLDDVIEHDERSLLALGLSFEQVADYLALVIGQAERRLELARRGRQAPPETARPWLSITAEHTLGFQTCPFCADAGEYERQPKASADYVLRDIESGISICVPGLLPHLIREHHFFEGSVPYRTDPTLLARVLRLDAARHETPQWRSERVWTQISYSHRTPWFVIGGPRRYWDCALMKSFGFLELPRAWDQRIGVTANIDAHRYADWCVVIAKRSIDTRLPIILDGSDCTFTTFAKGTYQFIRRTHWYVSLEQ
jgi:hypothetical protein